MPDTPPALEVRDVTKAFGSIVALNNVSFTLRRREIHALVGHNGAGKSTLVKVLAGVVSPDQGEVLINGTPVTLANARQAQAAGIAVVEQELSLVPALTVMENILLGRVGAGLDSRGDDRRQVQALLTRLGLNDVRPDTVVEDLSMAERQLVEIARALSRDARILVLDDPTATPGDREIQRVFAGVRELAGAGRSVIFVSHRLGEVLDLCSRVTVMRDGRMIASWPAAEMDREGVVELMLGKVAEKSSTESRDGGVREGLVIIDRLSVPGHVTDFALRLNGGEIVAIAGQVGSGARGARRADPGRARPCIDRRPRHAPRRPAAVYPGRRGVRFQRPQKRGAVSAPVRGAQPPGDSPEGGEPRRRSEPRPFRGARSTARRPDRVRQEAPRRGGGNAERRQPAEGVPRTMPRKREYDSPAVRRADPRGRRWRAGRHSQPHPSCRVDGRLRHLRLDRARRDHGPADTVVTMFAGRITRIGRREEMTAADILAEMTSGAPKTAAA
jgi:ABC-type multidrug transport system ATPase subunit